MLRRLLIALCLLPAGLAASPDRAEGLPTAAQVQEATHHRAALMPKLGARLLVVPARMVRKAEDQPAFRQEADFYYLTGLSNTMGAVLVVDGQAQGSHLFVPPQEGFFRRWAPEATPAMAARLDLAAIHPLADFPTWYAQAALRNPGPGLIAGAWPETLGPAPILEPGHPILGRLRQIKTPRERELLRKAGEASVAALRAGFKAIRPGAEQRAVEVAVVGASFRSGDGPSFWPWAMAGPNAPFPGVFSAFSDYHHLSRRMQTGELVRLDVGSLSEHYAGDVGRTVPVSGRFDPGQREAWNLFIRGYRAGMARLRAGQPVVAVYEAVRVAIRQAQPGLRTPLGKAAADTLLGPGGTRWFELHGVGLDSAEGLPDTLEAGMVVAYELMVTVNGQGFYLEDMVAITEDGYEWLTPGLPYTAEELEMAMRR